MPARLEAVIVHTLPEAVNETCHVIRVLMAKQCDEAPCRGIGEVVMRAQRVIDAVPTTAGDSTTVKASSCRGRGWRGP